MILVLSRKYEESAKTCAVSDFINPRLNLKNEKHKGNMEKSKCIMSKRTQKQC